MDSVPQARQLKKAGTLGRSPRRRVGICTLLLLGAVTWLPSTLSADALCFFLDRGRVYQVDVAHRLVTPMGDLHPTAPAIDVSADGLIWGRGSLTSVAALDPFSTKTVRTVELPDRPYAQIISPAGTMYVAHNTLTAQGFAISVVDLAAAKVVGQIRGIQGLVTGLAYHGGYVYAAALGVRRPDFLYLYRIDARSNQLEELYRAPRSDYRWEIAVHEGRLFLTCVGGQQGKSPPCVEVVELESGEVADRWTLSSRQFRRFTQGLVFAQELACAAAVLPNGEAAVVALDPRSGAVRQILPVGPGPCRVVGSLERCFISVMEPELPGDTPVVLFHEVEQGGADGSVSMSNQKIEEDPL